MYKPNPIDTSHVNLPEELIQSSEQIAKNVHEVWAKGRLADGWRLGDKTDTELKITPCLIPYEELPESEKDYDRNTAIETLKVLVAIGFTICPPRQN